jgi:hypothetical protein
MIKKIAMSDVVFTIFTLTFSLVVTVMAALEFSK